MSIDFVSIVLYDMYCGTNEHIRAYVKFRKQLLKSGYYQLQESVYVGKFKTKEKITTLENHFVAIAPDDASIRSMTMTEEQFKKTKIIAGDMTFGETVITKKDSIIEV